MSRARLGLAGLVVGGSTVAGIASPLLARASGGDTWATASTAAGAVMLAVVGALVLVRRPTNKLGAIFSLAGVLWAVGDASNHYANLAYRLHTDPSTPSVIFAAWISEWFWIPWLFLTFVFSLLLFPTGRLPSDRWKSLAWLAGVTVAVATVAAMLESELTPAFSDLVARNPVGIPGHVDVEEGWVSIWLVVVPISAVGALISLVARYRRARGEERQQIKVVTFAACLLVGGFVSGMLGELVFGAELPVVEHLLNLFLPVAAGIAILKHGLFEIDVVISRTVVFAGLAAFITTIYVSIVVGIGSLLGAGGEPNLALSIVATAVVAVAFQPVRERLTRLANRLVFGKRATPYEVLSKFSSHLGETVATEDTLEKMARLLADGTGAAHAQVSLAIGGQMIPAASVGQVVDASAEAHTVEVTHQGEVLGALSVTKKRGETLTPADVKLVDDLAAQAGLLLRNVRLTEELKARIVDLRASRQRLVAAQDAERRRLERDLHDGAQQHIVAIKLKLGIARTLAAKDDAPETVELVDQLMGQADDCVQTLRELAHGIYPPLLAAEGLPAALATHARRTAIPVTVQPDGVGRYSQEVEAAVYFCVLEAVNNAAKYAAPSQITVRLTGHDGRLTFEVSDDGTGFDPTTTVRGHGLTNMTDRLDALGGELEIRSQRGRGSTVRGTLTARSKETAA